MEVERQLDEARRLRSTAVDVDVDVWAISRQAGR